MEILDLINSKFNNKYDYLRVFRVDYNTLLSYIDIEILYPESVENLGDEEQTEIAEFIKQILNISRVKVNIVFRKSILDSGIIKNFLIDYLKTTYSSLLPYFTESDVNIENTDGSICIKIQLISNIYNYFLANNIASNILETLNKNFIANFNVLFACKNREIDNKKLESREKEFYENLPKPKPVERYEVFEPETFIGKEITPMPEPIKNQKENKESVILAGKISSLTEKTYISRRAKAKGSTEQSYYFKFLLTDHTGGISSIYFSNKTTYKKAINLKDGDSILVIGNVKNENGRLTLMIKDISFCEIYKPQEIKEKVEAKDNEQVNDNDDYKVAKPTPYFCRTQENLFDVKPVYEDEIYKNTYVVFDTETTGLECKVNEIIEIGAVKVIDGLIKEQFQTFIRPIEPIPEEITKITHITNEMVENAPCSKDAIKDFHKFCKGCILVGYNVAFDMGFINEQGQKVGITFDNESIDAMAIARKKLVLTRFKLTNVVDALNLKLDNAHRAIFDATATAYVFLKLSEKWK